MGKILDKRVDQILQCKKNMTDTFDKITQINDVEELPEIILNINTEVNNADKILSWVSKYGETRYKPEDYDKIGVILKTINDVNDTAHLIMDMIHQTIS